MIVQASGELNFQVMDAAYSPPRRFMVKLKSRTCDCGYWEIAGLPCQHAMVAIGYARHAIEEYVPAWFATQTYLNTYSKKVGRPKKSRKRAENEPNKKKRKLFVICSFCGGSNHNLRSYPLRPFVARENRAKNHNSQASTTSIQPLNASQQATTRRKQIPSGPGQSSNTRARKRRAQVGSGDVGTSGGQSSEGLS
ncbi:hypothetical protein WN943_019576 [Citrus x changshan-huyou]